MSFLFTAFVSISSPAFSYTDSATIYTLLASIGFDVFKIMPHRGHSNTTLQNTYNSLQQADLFVGIYTKHSDYTRGGLLYYDTTQQLYAIGAPKPLQIIEYEWAQRRKMLMVRIVLEEALKAPDNSWRKFITMIATKPNTYHITNLSQQQEYIQAILLEYWSLLWLAACWQDYIHPELLPKPNITRLGI